MPFSRDDREELKGEKVIKIQSEEFERPELTNGRREEIETQ